MEESSLKGRDLLSMADLTPAQLAAILATAAEIKNEVKQGIFRHPLAGQTLALVFEKPSLRTRLSFDVGMFQLGGRAMYLAPAEVGLGKRETISDVARVISSMCNVIVARVFRHSDLEEMARYSNVPVVNGLSDFEHPCQALADLLTIQERFGHLEGLKMTYIGDGNNMAHSLMLGAALSGMRISVVSPEGYEPDEKVLSTARQIAGKESDIMAVHDLDSGLEDADIIYTDVWASMGQEEEAAARRTIFMPYQVNAQVVSKAKAGALVLHCLPAHRGDEITEEVLEGPQSAVFQQAENRLHAQKGLLVHLLG
ncbi:MAG TPA: ornithine carbamoyltransferase [Chloroflexia bacterium]|nr:ornithine carbamoyltransferase [Chloroflexia bacterium]